MTKIVDGLDMFEVDYAYNNTINIDMQVFIPVSPELIYRNNVDVALVPTLTLVTQILVFYYIPSLWLPGENI